MAKPVVIVVGADKGGVGKTTVSRTVLDYFSANNVPTRAFDTESPRGTLKRFHPEVTEIVDMTSTSDQMKIFDTLNAVSALGHRDRRPRRPVVADAGLTARHRLSRRREVRPDHLCRVPHPRPVDRLARRDRGDREFHDGAKYFLVKNFINNTSFFEWDQATYNSYFHRIKDATEITIPKLNEMAYEQVEVASVPFLKFVANKGVNDETANYSFVLRGYVRHWLANVWGEFDRIKLTDLVGAKPRRARRRKIIAARSGIWLDWAANSPDIAQMSRTPVYIICSPRPLVGKTLVARLLSEYLLLKNGAVNAFDVNLKEPSLLDYLPENTETAEVDDTYGKMQLMDRLIVHDGVAKVIDLGFHAFDEFFKMSEEIGFMKEAARRSVAPVVLFVADTDRFSARGHAMLRQQVPRPRW